MSSSSDAFISFGYDIGENEDAPWVYDYDVNLLTCEFDDGDIDGWWWSINKFVPTLEIYDEEGNRLPNITSEQTKKYWSERDEFKKLNPMPFKCTDTCSSECSMYILSVPGSQIWAQRGSPAQFNPEDLKVDEEKLKVFNEFVEKYFPQLMSQEPKWYLSSYYG